MFIKNSFYSNAFIMEGFGARHCTGITVKIHDGMGIRLIYYMIYHETNK